MFSIEELKNISALIANAQIRGSDALVVAQIQLKINQMLNPKPTEKKDEEKAPKKQ